MVGGVGIVQAQQNRAVRAALYGPVPTLNGKPGAHLSNGTTASILERSNAQDSAASQKAATGSGAGVTATALGCSSRGSAANIRVNQDCTFRRQAEEQIAVDPNNPNHIVAGQNDSRIGFNHCGFDYSFDGGSHWGDGIPPFYQHLNTGPFHDPLAPPVDGTFHTYDAGSDPALAVDSRGNTFFSCVVFDVASAASGLFVTGSTGPQAGSAYGNVGTANTFVVTEDNDINIFNDKEFIAADSSKKSPFRDNVYVTWSRFDCTDEGCISPIFFSRSTDHAQTWSRPVMISGNNPAICVGGDVLGNGAPNDCNNDQGSSPVVGPDGTIYVAFNNGNTPNGNPNFQQLLVVSHDAGKTWSPPISIGHDFTVSTIDGSPFPTCDFGRGPEECIPAGINVRTDDFPTLSIDSTGKVLAAVWQDYRNGVASNENFDVIMSSSTDGGATWQERTVFDDPTHTAQFQPAVAINQSTGHVAVSYYDRSIPGDVAHTTYDYSISIAPTVAGPMSHVRVTDVSSPSPELNPVQAGFLGDYSSVAWSGNNAMPLWSDGRNLDPTGAPDEDVFTARVPG
jgi:hypothetical protein